MYKGVVEDSKHPLPWMFLLGSVQLMFPAFIFLILTSDYLLSSLASKGWVFPPSLMACGTDAKAPVSHGKNHVKNQWVKRQSL